MPLTFPTISEKNDKSVYANISGHYNWITFEDFLKVNDSEIAQYFATQDDTVINKTILEIMLQFQVSCQQDELDLINTKIIAILKHGMASEKNQVRLTIEECIKSGDIERIAELSAEYKRYDLIFNQKYQPVLALLNTMVSQKGVVSKVHSLERIARKNVIKDNVKNATNMSSTDIFKAAFDENGAVILNLEYSRFSKVLRQVSNFTKLSVGFISSDKFIDENVEFNCTNLNARCRQLDTETLHSVVEICEGKVHDLSGSVNCVALPGLASEGRTSIPIPLSSEFMTKTYPEFKSLANNPKFSCFRINLRGTISDAVSSREFNISKDSTVLGASISMIVLEALESFTEPMNNVILEEGSTAQQIARGLLGFVLTTMASGVNGQFGAWEVFDDARWIPSSMKCFKICQRLMLQARLVGWVTPKVLNKYLKTYSRFIEESASK